MITIEDINVEEWMDYRLLDYKPLHFVTARTPVTDEAKLWIREKLKGRYCFLATDDSTFNILSSIIEVVSFEDPKDAVFYELTWS